MTVGSGVCPSPVDPISYGGIKVALVDRIEESSFPLGHPMRIKPRVEKWYVVEEEWSSAE